MFPKTGVDGQWHFKLLPALLDLKKKSPSGIFPKGFQF